MFGFLALSIFAGAQNKIGFDLMVNALISGKVDTVNSAELKAMIDRGNTTLLDSRQEEEFDVSHLQNATWVGYEDFDLERVKDISKDDTIVVYCSIGKRSGDVAEKLTRAGYKNVFNLYGGIFDWTNRGNPVVNNQNKPVKQVHPYNTTWGIWVNNYEKRYEPR